MHIISYIPAEEWPRLETVSRQFRYAVVSLWWQLTDFDISKFFHGIPKFRPNRAVQLMQTLSDRNKRVTTLRNFRIIARCINPATFKQISAFTNLSTVSFAGCSVNLSALSQFLKANTQLKVLDLRCSLSVEDRKLRSQEQLLQYQRKNDALLKSGFSALDGLEALDLSRCDKLCGDLLTAVATHRLKEVAIGGFSFSVDSLFCFLKRCSLLEILDLSHCGRMLPIESVDDIEASAHTFTNLRSFILGGCASNNLFFVKQYLNCVLSRSNNLTELHLQGCPAVSNNVFQKIIKCCRKLRCLRLCVRGLLPQTVLLIQGLPDLRILVLDGCHSIDFFDVNTEVISAICKMQTLEYLNVGLPMEYPKLSSSLLHASHLKGLCISGACLSNASVAEAVPLPELSLVFLELPFCNRLSDYGLVLLLPSCPRLKYIDLSGTGISNTGLNKIPFFCKGLREIKIAGCKKLTCAGIAIFKRKMPAVKVIEDRSGQFSGRIQCSTYALLSRRLPNAVF
ncbi:unnamed protein product [Soboliphyme baturini]|uniref:F-box domain-containing protein n=1 Tax=Soboliphyme baturini TaxID=241478 RepID=A0A183IE25_9BILA|nr:unnamed protein product [Soboliphyme baturini]